MQADSGLATEGDRTGTTPPAYVPIVTRVLEEYAGVKFGITNTDAEVTTLFGAVLTF